MLSEAFTSSKNHYPNHVLKVIEKVYIFMITQLKLRPFITEEGIRHHIAHFCI